MLAWKTSPNQKGCMDAWKQILKMGGYLTKPSWRESTDWRPSKREQLKQQVKDVERVEGIPYYNILLVGQISSGKSSYVNAIKSVMRNQVIKETAKADQTQGSMTKKLRYYELQDNLPFRMCDTMGLEPHDQQEKVDADIMNLVKSVRGNVPNGYEFSPGEEFTDTNPRFINNPSPADRAHCVAIVIDASQLKNIKDSIQQGLQNLKDKLDEEEAPVYAILTHMDMFSTTVKKNVADTYSSKQVHELVYSVSRRLHGLPENHIFPVVNYEEKIELSNAMDILLLLPLRQMLYSASSHVENISTNINTVECGDKP